MTRTIRTFAQLEEIVGDELGASDWRAITQAQVDRFGEAVGDTQWIHCDPERAARESPFGTTIVHGMLLLSLLSEMRDAVQGVSIEIPRRMGVFYGLNKVRFIRPVPVGARVRVHLTVAEARMATPDVIHVVYDHRLEIENDPKAALVAEAINRIYLN